MDQTAEKKSFRTETDALGSVDVPDEAYWGIHTQRAVGNFRLSGQKVPQGLIRAMAMVKKAACVVNRALGFLPAEKASAICDACDEIIVGKLADQFPLDALQGGAGTSTNMNVNEVIANRALEILSRAKGDYDFIHPIEDVNRHQSTNDVYPTAVKMAVIYLLRELSQDVAELQGAFQRKEKEFAGVVKIGRTELVRAVPITLGAEFSAFAEAFGRDRWRTFKCEERLRVVNLGGTAVGTGLGAPRDYIFRVTDQLRAITGLGLARGENLMGETANADPFVEVSGILKAMASNLIKVANDLRLMSLLGEIILPRLQAGSSIMPGKINPVVLEAVMQAGMKVTANDGLVAASASRATFQINEFMPLLSWALLDSLEILGAAAKMFAPFVDRIEADERACRRGLDQSDGIVTAFVPSVGYEGASALLEEFRRVGRGTLREFLEEKLGTETVSKILSPQHLMSLGYREHANNA